MASVFISYRRSDCPGHAGRLYDRIVQEVGREGVFRDIDAIPPGVDFTEHIQNAISSCSVLLALIGTNWLDSGDHEGRRLDHPDDLVRFEIATALRRPGVRVIPVLVEDAKMPAAGQLPEDLRPLAGRNAFELRDLHWSDDVDRLLSVVALATGAPPPDKLPNRKPAWRASRTTVIAGMIGVALIAAITAIFVLNPSPGPSTTPSEPLHACSDGKDNDRDGEIDFPADPDCSSLDDPAEKVAACADGKDNDRDGATDFPDDGECTSKDDIAEQI